MAKATNGGSPRGRSAVSAKVLGDTGNVRSVLSRLAPYLDKILPKHMDGPRLAELAFFCVRQNPDLLQCTESSFGAALIQCGRLGLYPDVRGHAYIIPRRTGPRDESGERLMEAHFQVGYQGMLELARRSGDIARIDANVVREGDAFDYEYGTTPYLRHKPCRNPGALEFAWCIAFFADGKSPQFRVVSRADIARIPESQEPAGERAKYAWSFSPWCKHPEAMWCKTAAKRLAIWLPASVEDLQHAVALDNLSEAGVPQLPETELPTLEAPKEDLVTMDDLIGAASRRQEREEQAQHSPPRAEAVEASVDSPGSQA